MPEKKTATQKKADRHHPGRGAPRLRLLPAGRAGLITGAADDDPAGIGTYSQIGAAFRFDLVWTAPLSLPLASAVQETSARLDSPPAAG